MKALLAAVLLASCSTKPIIPTNTQTERDCLQHYRSGEITWAEYQTCLKAEKTP